MNILSLPAMVFSSEIGWLELEKDHPSLTKLFCSIVLPLSFIPPAMLFYAGTMHGDAFVSGYGDKPWGLIATGVFVLEIALFFAMGWFVRLAASYRKIKISHYRAYALAAIAPVPFWLAAFALFVTNIWFNAVVGLIALACSCGLVYHGIVALGHMKQDVKAQSFTYLVISAGILIWMLFLFIVMLL